MGNSYRELDRLRIQAEAADPMKCGMWKVVESDGRVLMGRMPEGDAAMWDAVERAARKYGGGDGRE